jgi:signal transduction histidine kinase
MDERWPNASAQAKDRPVRPADSAGLSRTILHCASRGLSKTEFLHEVSKALMSFSGCDAVEVRLSHGELHYRWEAARRPEPGAHFELARWARGPDGRIVPASREPTDLERLCWDVACQRFDSSQPFFTDGGSFWIGDAWERVTPRAEPEPGAKPKTLCVGGHYRSLAIMRFVVDEATIGLLHVKSEQPNCFAKEDVESYEGIAQTLGLAIADWRAQYALRERVKELTCLYGIAQVAERADAPLEEMFHIMVDLLPPAWQYPEIAAARIVVDDHSHTTPGFHPGRYQQSADIIVSGRRRGGVEVHYVEERPEFAAGAFLGEEEKLIAAVAREVALIVERKDAERERAHLQQQLIHADRLATIGQLAAGVAHELNEPLGSILGFAQLARKCPGLPEPAARDIEKIVTGSLYAREVIKKLMVFARQVPARKVLVNLNQVVEDSLYFLEARCAKAGTRVVRELAPELPEIHGDPAQLKQVLVNLVVNAVQAMPDGGTLTVKTRANGYATSLIVEDTGTGMNEEVLGKIFLPFFTTKDVNEGTGLGLPVVHGIVSSHGGSIDVQSRPGQGTRFEIRLPAAGLEQTQETGQNGDRG